MNVRNVPSGLRAPFLAAKVQPPITGSSLVSRERLTKRIEAGRTDRLTVVSGPAGAGKTSLLSLWFESTGGQLVAWLKLDASDNDPAQFWIGLLGSLSTVTTQGFAEQIPQLASLVRSDLRIFLSALGDALDQEERRVTVILDDLHEVESEDVHAGLSLVIEHLANKLRLIVASRTTPPLGLARLRARGELCEVRFDDLRFDFSESKELLERVTGGSVGRDTTAELQQSTDGWAAALYVAAIGIDADEDSVPRRSSRTGRHLSEYLVEEVLGREPPERQEFLLLTSILDRLNAERCNALTGRSDSADLLRQLQSSSQFVRQVGADGAWYAYHDLLRDLLREQLRQRRSTRWEELHRVAAAAALADSDPADAIHHSIEAGDLETAASTISAWWIDFTNRGLFASVMSWLDRWQEAEAARTFKPSDPTIFLVGSWMALHTGRLEGVERWLARAEIQDFDGPLSDGTSSIEAATAIVRCAYERRIGQLDASLLAGQTAVELETDTTSSWRAVACVGYANSLFWADRLDQARDLFDEARRIGQATSLFVPVLLADGYEALMDRAGGSGDRAMTTASAAVELAESGDLGDYEQAAPAYLAIALCQLDEVELDDADHNLAIALRLAHQGGERLLEAEIRLASMRLADLRGQPYEAALELEQASRIVASCPHPGTLLAKRLAGAERRPAAGVANPLVPQLTKRELTVLRYLQSPLTQPEIAAELFVSSNTVKTHVASIRTKLAVNSRREAVRKARELGLLT